MGNTEPVKAATQRLHSKNETAVILGVSYDTVERLMFSGELAYVRIRGRVRIDVRDIERYIERNRHGGGR